MTDKFIYDFIDSKKQNNQSNKHYIQNKQEVIDYILDVIETNFDDVSNLAIQSPNTILYDKIKIKIYSV